MGEGNSKLEVSRSTAQVAGPGLAGLLVRAVTAPYAVVIDALSFVASALFLSRIRREERPPERSREERPGMRKEIAEGLRFVVRHPLLRPITLFVAVNNVFVTALFAIFLVYAVRELDLTPQTIGLILSLGSVGSIVGALTANRTARTFGIGPLGGTLGSTIGLRETMVVGAAGACVAVPFLVFSPLRRIRKTEDADELVGPFNEQFATVS